jgi:hypothetical protein
MQSWWNVYLVHEKAFYFDCIEIYIYCSKDDKCSGYAMVLFEHATSNFDSSCLR